MKKKPEEPKKGAPAWQGTFGDLMNLLLCFFVLCLLYGFFNDSLKLFVGKNFHIIHPLLKLNL